MAHERSNSLSELAKLGFEELASTIPKLERLVDLLGDTGRTALAPVSNSASPDKALDFLIRLAETVPKETKKVLSKHENAQRLCRVLGASDGLGEFLIRHSDNLKIFQDPAALPVLENYRASFEKINYQYLEVARAEIRILYRKLLTQIADWDLEQDDFREAIKPVTAGLSDLAGAALEASLSLSYQELISEEKFTPEEILDTKLAIIAMGKCGARELNYLSDVDVIFVVAGDSESLIEIGTRLATRTMRNLDMPATEPPLWQVDANLRPEGKSGALVRTLDAHISYYQKWAENWEFQALLKARAIAGDASLGASYIEQVTSLIWTRPNRSELVETVRRMRQRVLENIPASEREFEIKLGRGGLRDIEFTVQLLQLVHGVTNPEVRAKDTLSALDALGAAGFIGRQDKDRFKHHYQTLRALEHRVQLSKLRRDHLLPNQESDRRRVARGLGEGQTLSQLEELWNSTRAEVSELHDSVFYRPLLNAMATLGVDDVQLSDEQVALRLEAMGFADARGAIGHLSALTQGVTRRATIQRALLPVLLKWLGEGVNPDRGLLAFRRLSEELGETHWFLRMLRDSSGAAERLMRVLSSSELIARLLEHIPNASEWFGDEKDLKPRPKSFLEDEVASLLTRNQLDSDAAESLRAVRRREVLRLAVGGVLGAVSIDEVASGLTELTDIYLLGMLEVANRGCSLSDLEFELIAMGRLGGAELGFGSDADAIFVYRSNEPEGQREAEEIASRLLSIVRDPLLSFELDIELRPEGKQGSRVRSLDSYAAYYQRWADVWEFQALLRARSIRESSLSSDFIKMIDLYRYPQEISQDKLIEIRRIKARVEAERLPQGADSSRHFKLGKGSLSDVEWLVQQFQLRYAFKHPQLKVLGTLEALKELVALNLIESEDAKKLEQAWRLASRARSGLVLANDRSNDSLPNDRRQLEALARILEYPAGGASELEQDYLATTRKARIVFEKLFTK